MRAAACAPRGLRQVLTRRSPPTTCPHPSFRPSACDSATPLGAPAALAFPPLSCFLRRTLREFSKTQYGGIGAQLRAGARYLDFRVSSAVHDRPTGAADPFWLVHGAVACVQLATVLADMAAFAAEYRDAGVRPPTVVVVCRLQGPESFWDGATLAALAARFKDALGADALYDGDAEALRRTPFSSLPAWIVSGVPGIGTWARVPKSAGDQGHFGSDVWINTYDLDEKEKGLLAQLSATRDRRDRAEESRKPGRKRADLYAFAWTVTPQPTDIVKRIVSCGIARPSLETEGVRFNGRFSAFAQQHAAALKAKANVVTFDFITQELSAQVLALNDGPLTEAGIGVIADDGSDDDSSSSSERGEGAGGSD